MLGQFVIDALVQIEKDTPIVSIIDPRTCRDIHRTIAKRGQIDNRCGILLNTLVRAHHLDQHAACNLNIIAIRNGDIPVDTTRCGLRVVVDDTRRNRAVGNVDNLVIDRRDYRVEERNLLDRTCLTLSLDVVANAIGTQQQDHHTTREILHRAAQCHTDSQRCRRKHRNQRSGVDTENADHGQCQADVEHHLDHILEELLQRDLNTALLAHLIDNLHQTTNQPATDEIDRQSNSNLRRDLDTPLGQHRENIAKRHILNLFGKDRCLLLSRQRGVGQNHFQ